MNSPRAWRCNGRPWSRMVAASSATRIPASGFCRRKKSTICSASPSATSISTTIPAFAPSSISAMVSYERLPMLEIVFDRLVRLMTTSLRNFTSDNVEVSLDRITSRALRRLPELHPAAGHARRVQGGGVGQFRPCDGRFQSLIYSIVDVLLGGRRGTAAMRIEGRPYTTIERNLVERLIEVVLADAEQAFRPLSPVTLPLRAAGDQSALRGDLPARQRCDPGAAAHRHGRPRRQYRIAAALRHHRADPPGLLLQMFMGEKFGRDPIWEGHFATEVAQAEISVDAVLYEADIPLKQLMMLKVGDTLPLEMRPRSAGAGPLRQRSFDRRTHGPGRRPGRHSRHQAVAQAQYHLRDVREGRRANQVDGGTMSQFPWRCNREFGGGAADAHDRLLHAAQQAAEAAEGGRAFVEGHDRRTDHRDRNRRAGDRRP